MALPSHFFQCPPLDQDERDRFKRLGIAAAHEVANKTQLHGGPIEWKLVSDEHELKIYKGLDTKISSGNSAFCSTIQVAGTMDEVVDLFRSQTTEQAREYCRRFGHLLVDAVSLYSIVPATESQPHEMIGISWRGFKAAVDKVVMRRDACILDVHHAFQFRGKRVWVRALKSVDLPCCPDLQAERGYVRMIHHITGHVFMESDTPGFLQIAYIIHSDVKGTVGDWASWVVDKSMRKQCRNLKDIDQFLRENRLSKTRFLCDSELVPTNLAHRCFLCANRFTPMMKKQNCMKCGEVCCSRCIRMWNVKNRGFDAQALVCSRCTRATPATVPSRHGSINRSKSIESSEYSTSSTETPSRGSGPNRQYQQSLEEFELRLAPNAWKSPRVTPYS